MIHWNYYYYEKLPYNGQNQKELAFLHFHFIIVWKKLIILYFYETFYYEDWGCSSAWIALSRCCIWSTGGLVDPPTSEQVFRVYFYCQSNQTICRSQHMSTQMVSHQYEPSGEHEVGGHYWTAFCRFCCCSCRCISFLLSYTHAHSYPSTQWFQNEGLRSPCILIPDLDILLFWC